VTVEREGITYRHGWIGVDFDGTLATYTTWQGADHVGDPILPMIDRVNAWLADGWEVRIFTARVSHDGTADRMIDTVKARQAIEAFCVEHFGFRLAVTNEKDYGMVELWDDRCVPVVPNVGHPASVECSRL